MPTLTRHDVMDEVRSRVETIGFEMGPGFTSHAPMAAEALVALGFKDEAIPWIDRYIAALPHFARVEPTPARIDAADEAEWRAAFGDHNRLGDWVNLFREEIENASWRDVLAHWWPRLLPGFLGGLTHGLIRTAHAVRTLADDPKPTQGHLRELCDAMAYMAAQYSPLPGEPATLGTRSLATALAKLPVLHPSQVIGAGVNRRRGGRFGPEEAESAADWVDAVNQLAPADDYDAALLALTHEAGNLLRRKAGTNPSPVQMIASVHVMTAPSAARMLLPHLPPGMHGQTYARVWQVAAGLAAAFILRTETTPPDDLGREPLSLNELRTRAIESGAAHAIKLTEACLRDYRDEPDSVYLFTAEDVLPQIKATESSPGG